MGSLGVLGSSFREFRGEGEAGFTLSRRAGYFRVQSWTSCGSRLWQQGEIPSGPYVLSSCVQPIHRHALPLPFLHKRSATDTPCMRAHAQSCLTLCDPRDCSSPDSSVHGIFQARIWNGLPLPSPGDLPHSGIEPMSLESPALAGGFFTISTRESLPDTL